MSSVSVFHEKEINGKPYHIFSLLPQTDNSSSSSSPSLFGEEAIDSGGESGDDDLSLQTRFFCPKLRFEKVESKRAVSNCKHAPAITSQHFNKETIEQQVQIVLDMASFRKENYLRHICKHPVLPIFWCNSEKPSAHFKCGACEMSEVGSGYYLCETCQRVYHKECVEAPLFIKHHPSYPYFSLQLCSHSSIYSQSCNFCETPLNGLMVYKCTTYPYVIHTVCALKPIPIIIDHFKRHPHTLTFFPKQAFLPCNICGMLKAFNPTYICARCVFVVHQDCIYFPYVIRICRHDHRISFTYSLPPGMFSCGVCRRYVNNSCGAYSCNKCDGTYFHSRCALRRDLWDGEELEGIPEEIEIVEDPFKTVADGEIIHFSHGHHHLKLEICRDYDEDKYCQACVLPIYEGNYYSCVDGHCDFILHETCANAPRKKRHPLHAHPLTLKVVTNEYDNYEDKGFFSCSACQRYSNGFVYEESSTAGFGRFRLDVRCASVSEPFNYEGHEHPLFLALSPDEEKWATCQICHDNSSNLYRRMLNCIKCHFIICFKCATLPYKARYKHDKHFLTFRKELVETNQLYWCEACEEKIVYSGKGGFYACDEYCCTTLHVHCLLGEKPYMKHDQIISSNGMKVHILRNKTMSRPICRVCGQRCLDRVVLQVKHFAVCSFGCLNDG
ncbi:unnamed protein product [Eruca vesicaria subsp. sativa]|uniref:Zinc finger PHD-type domain-containing protein n=1 Tax=Eruca vesicaria subsp. sativa TaxID=29727 RepID=A0ABC8LST8_ERUVS|nr:unnamed protein product [Eruca vesicaria subsp. sativa]